MLEFTEYVGMAHGMGWNGLEWPLESGGMNLESSRMVDSNHSGGFQMEFHGIPTFQSESTGTHGGG